MELLVLITVNIIGIFYVYLTVLKKELTITTVLSSFIAIYFVLTLTLLLFLNHVIGETIWIYGAIMFVLVVFIRIYFHNKNKSDFYQLTKILTVNLFTIVLPIMASFILSLKYLNYSIIVVVLSTTLISVALFAIGRFFPKDLEYMIGPAVTIFFVFSVFIEGFVFNFLSTEMLTAYKGALFERKVELQEVGTLISDLSKRQSRIYAVKDSKVYYEGWSDNTDEYWENNLFVHNYLENELIETVTFETIGNYMAIKQILPTEQGTYLLDYADKLYYTDYASFQLVLEFDGTYEYLIEDNDRVILFSDNMAYECIDGVNTSGYAIHPSFPKNQNPVLYNDLYFSRWERDPQQNMLFDVYYTEDGEKLTYDDYYSGSAITLHQLEKHHGITELYTLLYDEGPKRINGRDLLIFKDGHYSFLNNEDHLQVYVGEEDVIFYDNYKMYVPSYGIITLNSSVFHQTSFTYLLFLGFAFHNRKRLNEV